jgi:Transposase DDE domain group 1
MMNLTIQIGRTATNDEGTQILNSFTLPVMEYARSSGLISLMDSRVHVRMKAVKYSPQDKLRELMCSIVAGCEHTVSINHRLVPDTALARELIGKDRFADQSGINRLLHAFTQENLAELEDVFEQDYVRNGRAWKLPSDERVVVDLDMTGFRVQGKSYEGAEKGYIERGRKGARGYKASFAYVHRGEREVLGCVFDGGRAVESTHIDRIVEMVKMRLGSPSHKGIILRGDPAYGTAPLVNRCLQRGYLFLFKGRYSSSARKYAKRIEEWVKVKDEKADGGEDVYAGELRVKLPGSRSKTRVVVFRSLKENKKEDRKKTTREEFMHLLTNLHESLYTAKDLLTMYHEREGIESFIKCDKSGLHMKNLRTRSLVGIKAFILLTCITHNLIVHAIRSMRRAIRNGFVGVKAFVEKLACAKGWFLRRRRTLILSFTEENPTIKQYTRYRDRGERRERPALPMHT